MIVVIVAVASFLITIFKVPYPVEVNWVPFMGYARASFLIPRLWRKFDILWL